MTINIHSFVIGEGDTEKEFQMIQLDAFKANTYLLKMKGMIGALMAGGLNSDATNLLSLLDEKTINDVIFPLLKDSQVTCISEKVKLDGAEGMRKLFTADNLDDFYATVWEVLKTNFGPFISKLAKSLFGVDLAEVGEKLQAQMKMIASSTLGKTSIQSSGSGGQ